MPDPVIPPHSWWKRKRDEAGGKSNLVGSVNIGKLLDKYNNATTMKDREKPLQDLEVGFTKYLKKLDSKKYPKVKTLAEGVLKDVKKMLKLVAMDKDAGLYCQEQYKKSVKVCKKLISSPDVKLYGKFLDGVVRGMGNALTRYAKINRDAMKYHKQWATYQSTLPAEDKINKIDDLMERETEIRTHAADALAGIEDIFKKLGLI